MEKQSFEKPFIEIVMFENTDIITTSNGNNNDDEWSNDFIVPM